MADQRGCPDTRSLQKVIPHLALVSVTDLSPPSSSFQAKAIDRTSSLVKYRLGRLDIHAVAWSHRISLHPSYLQTSPSTSHLSTLEVWLQLSTSNILSLHPGLQPTLTSGLLNTRMCTIISRSMDHPLPRTHISLTLLGSRETSGSIYR